MSLVSDLQFLDKILSPIFGINKIRIEVQGSAELPLGVKTNKVDNPTLPIDMRKTTSLISTRRYNSISAVISVIWSISIGRTKQMLLSIMTIS